MSIKEMKMTMVPSTKDKDESVYSGQKIETVTSIFK